MTKAGNNIIYTIGHSNHAIDDFVRLLRQHDISLVVDVRSHPYSQYCPHFNGEQLEAALSRHGLQYVYKGKELGARPDSPSYYEGKKVSFAKLVEGREFQAALKWLLESLPDANVALMCAEKDPICCHRMILLGHQLASHDVQVSHIMANGSLEDNRKAELRLVQELKIEPTLFEPQVTQKDLIERAYQEQEKNISSDTKDTHKTNV